MTNRDLYICTDDVEAKANENKTMQPVLIKKGQIVQYRFDSPKHFRTENEEYFSVSIVVWEQKFACIGSIWDKIEWNNKATLKEILNLHLYDSTTEQDLLKKKIKEEVV